jgi:hypothetical protein
MARKVHVLLGMSVLAVYLYVCFHISRVLPNLAIVENSDVGHMPIARASRGLLVVYGLPICAIACFLFPTHLKWWLSPRTRPLEDYLLTEGVWYVIGYGLLLLSIAVMMLFR